MPTDFIGLFAILAAARFRDVMLDPGISFEDLWAHATIASIGGNAVRIASIRHLIQMKEAAGRPQDLADVERLRALLAR